MEFELWMLLVFPLFFGMGWLTARIDIKQMLFESSVLPRSYFQGLNFLLNEQQDKAIEAFIEVVKVDPQTIELHFALGSLFRRRGEVDRAIRMHLNLIERIDLEEDKKQQALFELAQDYLNAGILNRAEELFLKLQATSYANAALNFLLELYQKEKDWFKAIDVTHRLDVLCGQPHGKEAAFFYCELAAIELSQKQFDAARIHLEQALEANPQSARATIMLGDIENTAQHFTNAIEIWQRIELQNPQYLPLVAERLLQAYRQAERLDAGIAKLQGYLSKNPSLDLMNVLFDAVLQRDGAEEAYRLVRDELQRNPTLLGLDKLLEAHLLEVPMEQRADVEMVKNLVHQRTRTLAMYRCVNCGFKARHFYWHCPACHGWETYSPRRSEENGLKI
ncbi:lipopolysaccharide assembly protein LapB [Candidatus Nitrotoga sp. M5]|uniref:lipopolysaccharide assembly protein LapB n=1 Tax=Candidatus Nitrotoga sp. M5 TaxID=2890409 RepID=UPI001EF2DCD4|nr:lipopolysaccharide assembly protein LapB [Candidatus Nitrotoga sp. M5]CAH1386442.1 Lipopolysaccharide assembly protein B [Candidatus Nitrotoga sp. M5]